MPPRLVTLLGVADDIWELDWLTKLIGQVLAAGLMAWWGQVQLFALPIAGTTITSSRLSLVVTVLVVVVAINAVNFVDGLDGLAAGVVAIGGTAFLLYTYLLTRNISADYSQRGEPSSSRCSSARAWGSCRTTSTRRGSSWATRARCSSG